MYILSTLFSHVESKSQEDRICNVNFGDTQTKVSPETVTRFDIKQMYKYSAISTFLPSEKGNTNAVLAVERNRELPYYRFAKEIPHTIINLSILERH